MKELAAKERSQPKLFGFFSTVPKTPKAVADVCDLTVPEKSYFEKQFSPFHVKAAVKMYPEVTAQLADADITQIDDFEQGNSTFDNSASSQTRLFQIHKERKVHAGSLNHPTH